MDYMNNVKTIEKAGWQEKAWWPVPCALTVDSINPEWNAYRYLLEILPPSLKFVHKFTVYIALIFPYRLVYMYEFHLFYTNCIKMMCAHWITLQTKVHVYTYRYDHLVCNDHLNWHLTWKMHLGVAMLSSEILQEMELPLNISICPSTSLSYSWILFMYMNLYIQLYVVKSQWEVIRSEKLEFCIQLHTLIDTMHVL